MFNESVTFEEFHHNNLLYFSNADTVENPMNKEEIFLNFC